MGAYRAYCELMEKNTSRDIIENTYFNMRILQEIYPERPPLSEIKTVDMGQLLRATNAIHFIMQEIVTPKFNELSDKGVEEIKKSLFDEYDEQNGYNQISENEAKTIWHTMKDNIDRVIRIATRTLHTGYKECLETDIMTLLDYVKFEINNAQETEYEIKD